MIYPGTSPFTGMNDPNSLENRKQQLMRMLTGQGLSTLSLGGSSGDAAAAHRGLTFNPFSAAMHGILGLNNAGQMGNPAVSAHPFFGGFGAAHTATNPAQAAAVSTGAATGSAGIGGVAGSPAAAPVSAVSPIAAQLAAYTAANSPQGAARMLFGWTPGTGAATPANNNFFNPRLAATPLAISKAEF